MKTLVRRLRRIEAELITQEDLASWRIANILYERLRRCAQAAGEPFEDLPPAPGARGPRLSVAETLRLRYAPDSSLLDAGVLRNARARRYAGAVLAEQVP